MVDSPEKAFAAASLLAQKEVDLVFLYVATYCLSSTILPVAQRIGCPVIVLNLQPTAAIDYQKINALGDRGRMTGMWLENCQACSVPEIANVFNRAGLRYDIVTGYLKDILAWEQIGDWVAAAKVFRGMRRTGWVFWATITGACSTSTPTSPASRRLRNAYGDVGNV